jgi:hypothetical protein
MTSITTSSDRAYLCPTKNDGSDRHYRGGFGSDAEPILMLLVRPAFPAAAKRRACPTLLQPALSIGVPRGCTALAGVLSIGDIKRSAEPTRTLLQTMPAPAAMPTCSPAAADAQFLHMPTHGPLALSSPAAAPKVDGIVERTAGGEREGYSLSARLLVSVLCGGCSAHCQ